MIRVTNNSDEIINVVGTNVPPGRSREVHEEDYGNWRVATGGNALHAAVNLKVEEVVPEPTPDPLPEDTLPKSKTNDKKPPVRDKAVKQKEESNGDQG